MLKGNFKLIYNYEDETIELYNIKDDIAEKNNIALANKDITERLKSKLFKWLKENNARMPYRNAAFNPKASSQVIGWEE